MKIGKLKYGVYGGLAGGLVFGGMMGMMGMLITIGQMAGMPSPVWGFVVHMMISAFIGSTFAVLFDAHVTNKKTGTTLGLLYGGIWWFLGPLTLMPLLMGMGLGANWSLSAVVQMFPSLIGHLIYGAILGCTYAWLGQTEELDAAADFHKVGSILRL